MGRLLHLILLALHTNLGEAQAKLDTTAAARTGGATPNLPDPVKAKIGKLIETHFRFWKSRNV